MSGFNLSEWALEHRSLVLYAMVVTAILGVLGFTRLGESEDPPFTFKVMVIQTLWPGASRTSSESGTVRWKPRYKPSLNDNLTI